MDQSNVDEGHTQGDESEVAEDLYHGYQERPAHQKRLWIEEMLLEKF